MCGPDQKGVSEWQGEEVVQEESRRPVFPDATGVVTIGRGGICADRLRQVCWGFPHQASTHNKNPQCLVDPEAQAQAQGSHHRDMVVAATERHAHCATF